VNSCLGEIVHVRSKDFSASRDQRPNALADRPKPLARPLLGRTPGRYSDLQLHLQAAHSHLKELVQIAAADRQKLRALEQRKRTSFGECQHTLVEVEPRKLAVEEMIVRRDLRRRGVDPDEGGFRRARRHRDRVLGFH
jgi:hypothetical protein